jgi:hypothetical protein
MEANARPPIMPHPPAPLGFAWLWFIEQKTGKRKEALSKRRSSDSAQAWIRRALCLPAKHPYPARSSPAIGRQATTNLAGIVLSDRSFAERLFGFSPPGLLKKRGSAKIRLG